MICLFWYICSLLVNGLFCGLVGLDADKDDGAIFLIIGLGPIGTVFMLVCFAYAWGKWLAKC